MIVSPKINPAFAGAVQRAYPTISGWWVMLSVGVLLLAGCSSKEQSSGEIVARVRDQVLTAGDLDAWELTVSQKESNPNLRGEFVRHWVEQELLYQEALTRRMEEDPWVIQRLGELKRDLMVARMMEIEDGNISSPTQDQITRYYKDHQNEYVWSKVHYTLEYWCASDFYGLDRVRANLIKGKVPGIYGGSGQMENGRLSIEGSEDTTPEIWRVISDMNNGEISKVINSQKKFWIFRMLQRTQPGSPKDILDVEEDIKGRLIEVQRHINREDLVRTLVDDYRSSGRLEWNTNIPPRATDDNAGSDSK